MKCVQVKRSVNVEGHAKREQVVTSGKSTTMQNFYSNRFRGFVSAHVWFRAPVLFLGGSWERLPPRREHRFWCKIHRMMLFRARKCLLGDHRLRCFWLAGGQISPVSHRLSQSPLQHSCTLARPWPCECVMTISFFKAAVSILLISNHNSFRVLFDKSASVYFIVENILIF